MNPSPYPWLLLSGIIVSLVFWSRLAKRDSRLMLIYGAALVSAFFGAKVVYLLAEGWLFWDSPDRWLIWATGKSVLGALLGGYAGVEIAKRAIGYAAPTGDWFAIVAPLGIALGRVGCLLHGCCTGIVCWPTWWTLRDAAGVDRWPAVPVELGFNVAAIGVFAALRRAGKFPGQLFHIYLIAYGLFRFAHEFLRATPRLSHGITGYQIAALAVAGLGFVGFYRRSRKPSAEHKPAA